MSNHDVDCLQRPLTRRSGCPSPRRQLAASVAAAEHGTVSQALPLLCGKNGSAICGIDRQASLSTLSVNRSSGACLALLHHQTRWAPSVRTGDFDPDWSDSEQHSAETDAFVATFAELRGLIGNRYDSRLGERRRRCSPLTVEQEAGHSAPASARPAISAAASAHGEATADFQEALLLKAREHPWAEPLRRLQLKCRPTATERAKLKLQILRESTSLRLELEERVAQSATLRRQSCGNLNLIAENAVNVAQASTPRRRAERMRQIATEREERVATTRQRAERLQSERGEMLRVRLRRHEEAKRERQLRERVQAAAGRRARWAVLVALASRTAALAVCLERSRRLRALQQSVVTLQAATRAAAARRRQARERRFAAVLGLHLWHLRLRLRVRRKRRAASHITHFLQLCSKQGRVMVAIKVYMHAVRLLQAYVRKHAKASATRLELLLLQCKRAEAKLYPLRPVASGPGAGEAGEVGEVGVPYRCAGLAHDAGLTRRAEGHYDSHVPWALAREVAHETWAATKRQHVRHQLSSSTSSCTSARRLPLLFSKDQVRAVLEEARRRMHAASRDA